MNHVLWVPAIIASVFLMGALVQAAWGKALQRGGWLERSKEPFEFWLVIAAWIVAGLLFLAIAFGLLAEGPLR